MGRFGGEGKLGGGGGARRLSSAGFGGGGGGGRVRARKIGTSGGDAMEVRFVEAAWKGGLAA